MSRNIDNYKKYLVLIDKYGAQLVEEEVEKLDDKKKKAFYMSLGINGYDRKTYKEIKESLNVVNSQTFVNRIFDNLEKSLSNPIDENEQLMNRLIDEYGKEKVKQAINSKCEKTRIIFNLYFGFNNQKRKTYKEINKLMGINSSRTYILNTLKDIEIKIKTDTIGERKYKNNEKYEYLINKYGEEEVKAAVEKMGGKSQIILKLYFGLEGSEPKNLKEISELLNLNNARNFMFYALNQVEKIINNKDKEKKAKEVKINNTNLLTDYITNKNIEAYKQLMINNQPFVEECVKKYIKIKNMSEKEIMDEFLGVGFIGLSNAINSYQLDTINKKFKIVAENHIKEELIKELKNKYKKKEFISLYDESLGLENMEDPENCIEQFIEEDYLNYVKNIVNQIVSKFEGKTKLIIQFYYGLDGVDEMTPEQISKKYGISLAFVKSVITKVNKYIKEEFFKRTQNLQNNKKQMKK